MATGTWKVYRGVFFNVSILKIGQNIFLKYSIAANYNFSLSKVSLLALAIKWKRKKRQVRQHFNNLIIHHLKKKFQETR